MKARSLWLPLACVAGVVVLVLGGIYGHWRLPFGLSWNMSRCQTDDEVDDSTRTAYETAALQFVRDTLGTTPDQAYAGATTAFKGAIARDSFMTMADTHLRPLRAIEDWRVTHSYYLTGVTVGQGNANPIMCTAVAHGSSSQPEGRVLVAHTAASEQTHVIVEGTAKGTTWSMAVWLARESDKWLVQGFFATPTGIVGKTAQDLWHLAREQHEGGRDFNAFILYATALQLSYRGPDLRLGTQPEINKELDAMPKPPELDRQAPYHWHFEGVPAEVIKVGPTPVDGKMYLLVAQELTSWVDDQDADRRNRALIREFSRLHPEYKDAFAGLTVDAVERGGGRVFRTSEAATASP